MKTKHKFFFSDSRSMSQIKSESVDLIVTSPAYPMIAMWDKLYGEQNAEIKQALLKNADGKAFELMHKELDKTWKECYRVLKKGGIACVNIGDATRTIADCFQLYSNHSRIIKEYKNLGFYTLPTILWHKKTNAPNKFMGSGMLPAGAYVTLEHEYILIFRKGPKRIFKTKKEKELRRRSAFFYEERNRWFSDIWFDLPGVSQNLSRDSLRKRSAAYPLELAYRLICMYSVHSDTILDPFAGVGTTALSAMAGGRNSISFELDKSFREHITERMMYSIRDLNKKTTQRLLDHIQYTKEYILKKGSMKYMHSHYGFPVMTAQETALQIPFLRSVNLIDDNVFSAEHSFEKPFIKKAEKTQINYEQIRMEML